jgi:hypothetical protein
MRTAMIVILSGIVSSGVAAAQVKTTGGLVKGTASADGGVRVFKGDLWRHLVPPARQ